MSMPSPSITKNISNMFKFEQLSEDIFVCTSKEHTFGTDAMLLAGFCRHRNKDIICELGTGCGIIAEQLCVIDKPQKIYAIDIQAKAIEQLKLGIEKSGLDCIEPILADLKDVSCIGGKKRDVMLGGKVDLVVCNPPYKRADSGIISDSEADKIARHETLCTINDICKASARLLNYGGRLCICNRPERLCDVITAMRENKIEPKRIQFVSKRADTSAWLFLIEGKYGGAPFLQVEPPIFMEE